MRALSRRLDSAPALFGGATPSLLAQFGRGVDLVSRLAAQPPTVAERRLREGLQYTGWRRSHGTRPVASGTGRTDRRFECKPPIRLPCALAFSCLSDLALRATPKACPEFARRVRRRRPATIVRCRPLPATVRRRRVRTAERALQAGFQRRSELSSTERSPALRRLSSPCVWRRRGSPGSTPGKERPWSSRSPPQFLWARSLMGLGTPGEPRRAILTAGRQMRRLAVRDTALKISRASTIGGEASSRR